MTAFQARLWGLCAVAGCTHGVGSLFPTAEAAVKFLFREGWHVVRSYQPSNHLPAVLRQGHKIAEIREYVVGFRIVMFDKDPYLTITTSNLRLPHSLHLLE